MSKRFQGMLAGILIGTLLTGSLAIAKSSKEKIEVTYDNIKVYKDNVLCETKDVTGTVVEPFIYNGTTYMPVRGTANLAGMDVTWNGQTKSVYLWDELTAEDTKFLNICPPYSIPRYCSMYLSSEAKTFEMAGQKYSDGLIVGSEDPILINLDSKVGAIECYVGHVDSDNASKTISFIVDGKNVKTVELEAFSMPIKVTVPLNYGNQLQIKCTSSYVNCCAGIGNIIAK